MDQQTYNRIIESGQPIEITAELLAAAQENGRRQRSEVVANGWGWLRDRLRSVNGRIHAPSVKQKPTNTAAQSCA